MALVFPISPTIGQTYQSGSSPIYTYNGVVWELSSANNGIAAINQYTASLKNAIQLTGSNATMLGNLNVQGTQTALNQSSLQITDKFIRVASGSLSSAQSNGAGLIIDGANVTMSWDSANSQITFNTQVSASKFVGDGSGLIGISSYTNSDNLAYLNSKGVVSGSSQVISILSSLNSYTASNNTSITALNTATGSLNTFTSSINTTIKSKLNTDGVISGSSQILNGSGIWSGSAQLPSNIISSSTQLNNLGYATTSSLPNVTPFLSSSTFNTFTSSLSGAVSSSTQITNFGFATTSSVVNVNTSSLLLTSSFNTFATSSNTFSASINTFTSSANTALSNVYTATASLNTFTSSYTTTSASFDSRISSIVNGSGFATTSSFNTLSASFNSYSSSINTFTASVNSATASLNGKTGSYATTGSNQFNGNQSITGSLTVNSGTIISSSLTANSSSLYLNSGSNFYLQNNGTAEISGSLKVSGSLTLSGSLTIQSGSIIMPNRPAFRVTGAGGPTAATTVISGSMVSVDYNEGGYYNTSNGTFTAPIAGLYQVNLVCRTYSNSGAASQAVVVKNNTAGSNGVVQIMIEWGANTSMNHTGGSTISKLAVGDTLKAMVFMGTASFDGNDNFSVAYIG
jgi:hypothetical protein